MIFPSSRLMEPLPSFLPSFQLAQTNLELACILECIADGERRGMWQESSVARALQARLTNKRAGYGAV